MTQLPYILEVALGIGLGSIIYLLLLRKHSLFQWRRFFIIFWPLLSFLIPLLEFERVVESNPVSKIESSEVLLDQGTITTYNELIKPNSVTSGPYFSRNLQLGFLKIYWIGTLLFLLLFLWKVLRLLNFLRLGEVERKEEYTLLESSKYKAAATFGKFILKRKGEHLDPMILAHELVHVRQKHTLDIIWMELLRIFQWFNPLIYFLHKELKETHEFIADQEVIQQYNKLSYAQLLVHQVQRGMTPALSIPFATFTKKRLIAMKTKTHHKMTKFRFLLLLPAVFCLLALFSMKNVEKPSVSKEDMHSTDHQIEPLALETALQVQTPEEPGDAVYPIKNIQITSSFGKRIHPKTKAHNWHRGVDFKAPTGTAVMAAFEGVIKKVENQPEGYGKHIVIEHADGLSTQYAHLDAFSVEEGQKVDQGQKVGEVGNTGLSMGPHLHFEIRKDGKPVNPELYLPKSIN